MTRTHALACPHSVYVYPHSYPHRLCFPTGKSSTLFHRCIQLPVYKYAPACDATTRELLLLCKVPGSSLWRNCVGKEEKIISLALTFQEYRRLCSSILASPRAPFSRKCPSFFLLWVCHSICNMYHTVLCFVLPRVCGLLLYTGSERAHRFPIRRGGL